MSTSFLTFGTFNGNTKWPDIDVDFHVGLTTGLSSSRSSSTPIPFSLTTVLQSSPSPAVLSQPLTGTSLVTLAA